MVRLQKYLSECGVASRRKAEELIEQRRVTVNGALAALGSKIDPLTDEVLVDGRPVRQETHHYLILNKPAGLVTSAHDELGRKTVFSCLKGLSVRVYPVGRLDRDVEGALLFTNDGELANRLMHPRHLVPKLYEATVEGSFGDTAADALRRGVPLEDGLTAPAKVELRHRRADRSIVRLTIHEGRKREVKRMLEAVGHPVRHLIRLAFAGIRVEGLAPGDWRYLTDAEVAKLRDVAAVAPREPE
jgi:23S rRNA pseudouridine2605 synthase